jgi:hypothetical protein
VVIGAHWGYSAVTPASRREGNMPDFDVLNDAITKAFDPHKPGYYANIFYISGTVNDLRVAFGTLKPNPEDASTLMVDKFDLSVTMPHSVAQELASKIMEILEGAKT